MQVYLETERLLLRRFTEADAGNLVELNSDPAVMRFLTGGAPLTRDTIEHEILPRFLRWHEQNDGFGVWAVIEKSTGDFLGWFGFRPNEGTGADEAALFYRLHHSAWGKGYATEVARALISKGFTELGVQRVVAQTVAINVASRRVMEKAGMTLVRTFHQEGADVIAGGEYGEVEYALHKMDWERRDAAEHARRALQLVALPGLYGICRLDPAQPVPEWALRGDFVSVTRTRDEVSVVCPEGQAPEGATVEAGWRCLKVEGPLDSALTGVLAALAAPLAEAGVSLFAVSTYDTDYLLVKAEALEQAVAALEAAGHRVVRE